MGVQGLWELLAPVGRRVSVETLSGKKLAIDASIWLVQFIKAMRDERGEMVSNAHLLGFFRRICKLLFLRTKPVFVFDGGTPALKRRTVAARRRQRENAAAKIRKTAEKLLLNHLKAKKLEELAAEIRDGKSEANREELDEMLAASIAAEEEWMFVGKEAASTSQLPHEEELDDDEFEELAIPFGSDRLDPTVLASLPPSVQLDLLVQMRERLMAENRQKYQKIKKSPSKFSELQIQSYLKTVAFRRDIDQVQRVAAGKGPEGLQTFRIASEANREFVFSSSFSGDKRKFSVIERERTSNMENMENMESSFRNAPIPEDSLNVPSSIDQNPKIHNQSPSAEDFGPDVETYRDERGRTRVSRVRGLGMRMTRDLQHNLDLILKNDINYKNDNYVPASDGKALQHNSYAIEDGHYHSLGISTMEATPMEVSFSADVIDDDDDVFSELVTGKSTGQNPIESCSLGKDSNIHYSISDSDADVDWEDRLVEDKSTEKSIINENDGLDWEDGEPQTGNSSKFVPQGLLEEESEIQEAIKRSLEDFNQQFQKGTLPLDSTCKTNAVDSPTSAQQGNGQRGFQDEKSDIQLMSKGNFKDLNRQSCDGTLPQDSADVMNAIDCSRISPRGNVQGGSPEEESEIQEAIKRSLEDVNQQSCTGSLIQDSPNERNAMDSSLSSLLCKGHRGLPEEEPEIKEVKERNNANFHQKSPNRALVRDSSSVKNVIDLHPNSVQCDGPASSQQITVRFDQLVASSESLLLTNTMGLVQSMIDADVSEKVLYSKSTDDVADLDESPVDKISVPALDEGSSGHDNDKVCRLSPGSSDKYVTQTGLTGETVPEEEYKYDSSILDGTILRKEALESELGEELFHLSRECRDLGDEQRKLERNAESVNSEMFAECQELLQMFGLPYIIAPMEAEAQCAYMEMMNLVDGIVTDDSDTFLFGAQNVYKNIFDDRKYVETYLMKDIESELGLTREKLIHMALLLGSDYTEGISGIGIVNAIEVVHAFPEEDGLREFREWVESPDPSIFGKLYPHIGDEAKMCSSKAKNASGDGYGSFERDGGKELMDVKRTFMEKHRNVSKNWHIPPSFPSGSVISAYINPQVDGSTDPFSWGKPDLPILRRLCWEKFGWPHQKADELLIPVLKEYNKHETQLRMEAFYTFNERFAKIRSQRIKRAVKGITGKSSEDLMNDLEEGTKLKGKKRRKSSSEVLEEENLELKCMQKSGRGRGRRGRGAARGRKSIETEGDLSDYSPQGICDMDIKSTSSELRRSMRRRINIPKENAEVNMSNEESQLSRDQPSTDQAQVNTTASTEAVCSYPQGGGGFCMDDEESQLSPSQPTRGQDEEQVEGGGFYGVIEEKEEREEISKGEAVDNAGSGAQRMEFQGEKEPVDFSFTPMVSLRRKRR